MEEFDPNIPSIDPPIDPVVNLDESIDPTTQPTYQDIVESKATQFPVGHAMTQMFDYTPVQQMLDPNINEDWVMGINDEFKNMIAANAPAINNYTIPGTSAGTMNRPGPAGTDYNPMNQAGILSDYDKLQWDIANIAGPDAKTEPDMMPDPQEFGIRSSNFDRYYHHSNFYELGFNPYNDNESYYNANSSVWDDSMRMWPEFGQQFSTGLSSIFRSIGDLFDDDNYFTSGDLESAEEMQDAMRIGMSQQGGASGFMNNLTLNMGYTMGIISEIALEEAALFAFAAIQGGLNPVADASFAGRSFVNFGRGAKAIWHSLTSFKAADRTRKMINAMRAAQASKIVYNTAKGIGTGVKWGGKNLMRAFTPETLYAMKYWRTTGKAAENMTNLARVSRTAGAFYRDLRAVNLAVSESKLEGGLVYNEQLDWGINEWNKKNKGKIMTPEDMKGIQINASDAAATTAIWNAPLIYFTNKLVLHGALGGFKPISRLMDDAVDGFARRVIRGAHVVGGKVQKDIYSKGTQGALWGLLPSWQQMGQWTVKGSVKRGAGYSLRYFSANLAEGIQEIYQEAVSHGAKDYYRAIYNDPSIAGMDAVQASMGEGIKSQWSHQGGEVFLSGFLMGGMIQGPQKFLFQGIPAMYQMKFQPKQWAEYQKNKENYITQGIKNLNKIHNSQVDNPDSFMDFDKLNFVVQKQAAEEMIKSAYDGDQWGYQNYKDDAKFQAIHAVLGQYRMKHLFKDQLKDYLNLSEQELSEAFPGNQAAIKSGKFKARIQDMIDQIDVHDTNLRKDKDRNPNKFDRSQFEVGTKEWRMEAMKERAFEHTRFLYMYTKNSWKRAEERAAEITKDLESHPVLSKLAANDLNVLSDIESIENEINLLQQDIDGLNTETAKEKKLAKFKTDKIRHLKAIYKILSNEKNLNKTGDRKGHFNKNKMGQLKGPLTKYLATLAEEKSDFVEWNEIKDVMVKLIDYSALKVDAKKYDRAVRMMEDPTIFDEIVERTFKNFTNFFENNKKEIEKRLRAHVKREEARALIKALEKHGVFPHYKVLIDILDEETGSSMRNLLQMTSDGVFSFLYTNAGTLSKASDPKVVAEVIRLINAFETAQKKEQTDTRSDVSTDEIYDEDVDEDFDTPEEGGSGGSVKVRSKLTTLKDSASNILERRFKQHQSLALMQDKKPLSYDQWRKGKEAKEIIKTFLELEGLYEQYIETIPEGKKPLSFNNWLNTQETTPEVMDAVNKFGYKVSDLTYDKTKDSELPSDKKQKGDKEISGYNKGGLYLIERTGEDPSEPGKKITYYVILDQNGDHAVETYSHLSTDKNPLKESYPKLDEAKRAYERIFDSIPDDTTFEFDGVELTQGTVVTKKSGKDKGTQYIVRSTPKGLARGRKRKKGQLWLLPYDLIDKSAKEKSKGTLKLNEGQFKGKYDVEELKFEPVLANVSKMRSDEFTYIYGWQNRVINESQEDAQQRLDLILQYLTFEELNSLEFQITMNKPDGTLKEFSLKGKDANSLIEIGNEKYEIRLVITDPAVRAKVNEALEKSDQFQADEAGNYLNSEGVIGFYQGTKTRVFKDQQGNIIDVSNATNEQLQQLFRPSGSTTVYDSSKKKNVRIGVWDLKSIRQGFAMQEYIIQQLLMAKNAGETSVPLSNLEGEIILQTSPGAIAFGKDAAGKPLLTPFSELPMQAADEHGNILIFDNQRVETPFKPTQIKKLQEENPDMIYKVDQDGVVYQIVPKPVSNLKGKALTKLYRGVKQQLEASGIYEQALTLGRYVAAIRMPNGQFTLAELQSPSLSLEEVNNLLVELKERASETQSKNMVREKGQPWTDAEVKDEHFNAKPSKKYKEGWNNEFNNKFYIYTAPGYLSSIKVSAYGYVQVEFYNKRDPQKSISVNISQEEIMEMEPDVAAFNLLIQEKIATSLSKKDITAKTKAALKILHDEGVLWSTDKVRASIPKVITNVEEFINSIESKLDKRIRFNVKLNLAVTDSAWVQAQNDKANIVTPKEDTEETGTNEQEDAENDPSKTFINEFTDEEFKLSREGDFADLTEYQLKDIANKMNDSEKLTPREEIVKKVLKAELDVFVADMNTVNTTDLLKQELLNKRTELSEDIIARREVHKVTAEELFPEDQLKAMREWNKLRRGDKELKGWEKQKTKVESDLNKIATKVLGSGTVVENSESLQNFIDWVQVNLPDFITIDDIATLRDRLETQGYTVGAFVLNLKKLSGGVDINGTIFTGENMPYRYHEAFHAVFRMLLTTEEQVKYRLLAAKEVRAKLRKEGKSLSDELQKLKNSAKLYNNLNEEQLKNIYYEEYMADEFQKFKRNPKSTKTDSFIKSLFNKIVEWIRSIFNNVSSRSELLDLYSAIDSGKYKTATIQNNAFTERPSEITGINVALAQIPLETIEFSDPVTEETKFTTIYMPSNKTDSILRSIGAIWMSRNKKATGKFNQQEMLLDIIDDFGFMYDPQADHNLLKTNYTEIVDELEKYHAAFTNEETIKKIYNSVEQLLGYADIQLQEKVDKLEEQEDGEGLRTSWSDKDQNMLGGFASLSKGLRLFMMMTTVREMDDFGNEFLPTGEPLIIPANFIEAYQGVLKAVAGKTDPHKVLQAMNWFSLNGNNQSAAVIDRIFQEIGITREQIEAQEFSNIKNPLFFQSVIKGFQQFRIDYMFVHKTDDGRTLLYDAGTRDDANSQFDHWNAAFSSKWQALINNKDKREDVVDSLRELQEFLNPEEAIPEMGDAELAELARDYATFIYTELGIKLSPTYLSYSIIQNITTKTPNQEGLVSAYEAEGLDYDDLTQMMQHVSSGRNFFADQDTIGIRSRIEKMARGNAVFDETIGATVFRNPNGDLVYAHQLPTMHLVKVAELNNVDALENMKQGAYLNRNMLLNDPAFLKLAEEGRLRITRMAGSKEGGNLDEDTLIETRGLTSEQIGVTYGDSTPQQFILDLINAYTFNYNTGRQKVDGVTVGTEIPQALAPILIRVIEASNTGDFTSLGVIKTVMKDLDGETTLTEDALNKFVNELENEYERIIRESNPETQSEDLQVGYNAEENENGNIVRTENGRATKLTNTGNLVSPKKLKVIDRSEAKSEILASPEQVELLYDEENPTTLIVRTPGTAIKIGLRQTQSANVQINKYKGKKLEEEKMFTIKNRGKILVNDENIDSILTSFGSSVSTTEKEGWLKFKKGEKVWYVPNYTIQQFLYGNRAMVAYDIAQGEDIEFKEEVVDEEEQSTTLSADQIIKTLKVDLENKAKEGKTFSQAIEEIHGLSEEMLKDIIEERLMAEFLDFRITLDEIKAYDKISTNILEGFKNEDGVEGALQAAAMDQYNMIVEDPEFNLMQIFFNDWLNSKSFNDVLLGDQALSLKDQVDKIKRAKAQNAAGYSADSMITAPEFGINHIVDNITLFTITDPKFRRVFDFDKGETGEKADAQMWMTVKAFSHMWFGFGKLNAAQDAILNKIRDGEKLTSEEVYGNPELGISGLKSFNGFMNSKKLVYADGHTFLKMSAFVLTKELTSKKNKQGAWVAKQNRVELHNLREKLENFETEQWEQEGNGTLAIAAPMSASKMNKTNVLDHDALFNNPNQPLTLGEGTDLHAKWMRLQMVNPSNKLVITDPTQMKSIITSEQDDSTIVVLNGEEATLGDVREAYNKATNSRAELAFINKRNSIVDFNIKSAMRELNISIKDGETTINLYSFLQYALDGLEASGTQTNLLEYFRTDEDGQATNLNNPITVDKFEQLFLSYFSKGVFSEKTPGHAVSLLSSKGFKVYRRVFSLDENDQPLTSEIIREDQWENMSEEQRPTLFKTEFDNPIDKTFTGLRGQLEANPAGIVILDELRFNVLGEDKVRYAEFIMPPHFKSIMDHIIATGGQTITAGEIHAEWGNWAHTETWSPKAKQRIVRSEIPDFDANRSKKEFATAFGYETKTDNAGFVKFVGKNGDGMFTIPAAIAKAFGVRIPSQDMHSSINLKLVDFMPAFYGSTGVFADELIEVSGADFDIDKLYMMINEFYNNGPEFHAYGSAKTKVGKYNEYVQYQMKDAYRAGSTLYDARIRYNKIGTTTATSITDRQKEKAKSVGFTDEIIGALNILGLPVTQKQYETYKEDNSYTVAGKKVAKEPYSAPINNDILNQKLALLGNEGMTRVIAGRQVPIAYESATVDPLVKEWEWIEENLPELAELVDESDVDVDNLYGKLRAFGNNKEGANSIGAAVLPNVVVNLLAENNIKISSQIVGGREILPQIKFNGKTFSEFSTSIEIDPETGVEKVGGHRTQFIISALITAMTDNAKERLAAKLGLNKDSLAVVLNLTALGVPIRTSILLINNPIIKAAYFRANNKDDQFDPGVYKILKGIRSGLAATYKEVYSKDIDINPVVVTDTVLMDAIKEMDSFDPAARKAGTLFSSNFLF